MHQQSSGLLLGQRSACDRSSLYGEDIPQGNISCTRTIRVLANPFQIVVVTTGSGIGPVLAVIQDVEACGCAVRVLWSAPTPVDTFGKGVLEAVEAVDANAVIIDTRMPGRRRPDMVQIAYDLYKKSNAEAVFCISNPKLTRKIVYGLEGRGVPAFGPVWDS